MGDRDGRPGHEVNGYAGMPHPGRDESRSLDKSGTYNAHSYAVLFCETSSALLYSRYETDLRCTIILIVFLVRMVSDLFGSSSRDWLGASSKVTRWASVASKSWASIKAK